RDRERRVREHVRRLVAQGVEHDALPTLDGVPQQVAVAPESDRVLRTERLDERGRALDVGEEQRHSAAGELRHRFQGIAATILVPSPTGLSTSRLPSSASTRSTRPRSPVPRARSAPPTPSSAISTIAWPSTLVTLILATVACAYLPMLASASEMT